MACEDNFCWGVWMNFGGVCELFLALCVWCFLMLFGGGDSGAVVGWWMLCVRVCMCLIIRYLLVRYVCDFWVIFWGVYVCVYV